MNIAAEQAHVNAAYAHLGDLIAHLEHRLSSTSQAPSTGTGQDILEREALLENLIGQLRAARAAEQRLCFGATDGVDGSSAHIGRIGLRDEAGEPLLLDWRAPSAASFYQATAVEPMGLRARRRIATSGRTVTHVEDEDLTDVLAVSSAAAAAVEAPRDGRMADIVATIAGDQDRIIRSPLEQITVVEGAPGTGKTVVALHRAAWLLYTHRDRLAKHGVLVIGPSRAFLHYIDQVLPSLGETDVVLLTPGQLYPPVSTDRTDTDDVAAIKGRMAMVDVIRRAVHARRRIPKGDVQIVLEDGTKLTLRSSDVRTALRAVPKSASFHAGREPFLRRLMAVLTTQLLHARHQDPSDEATRRSTMADLADDIEIRRTLNTMWLPTTPEHIVGRLLTDPTYLATSSAGSLSPSEQERLLRAVATEWTVDDVPLLDEAAELLGPWDPQAAARRRAERAEHATELSTARRAMETFGSGAWLTAEDLVARHSGDGLPRTVAERAMEDRDWIYGHVVVDEAQDLSAMAWRVIERRCKRRSATIVGDMQQSAHPAALRTWEDALRWAGNRVDVQRLSITYRITKQTAETAVAQLIAGGGSAPHLRTVRDGPPAQFLETTASDLGPMINALLQSNEGRAAVIYPDAYATWAEKYGASDAQIGTGADGLDLPIALLTVAQTKGLEFNDVVIIDPDRIAEQRPRGADIYVASTRPTQRLYLVNVDWTSS
jgi:DNA helicase IV